MQNTHNTHNTQRLRVALVNHAYASRENQKSLSCLAEHVELLTIVPDRTVALRPGGLASVSADVPEDTSLDLVFKKVTSVRGQQWLEGFSNEFKRFQPDVVHVESAPWSPVTAQTLWHLVRHAPRAKLVLTIRKNTYVPLSAPWEQFKEVLQMIVAPRVSAYMVESEMAAQLAHDWLGISPDRTHFCRQLGVDISLFCPPDTVDGSPTPCIAPSERPFVVGFVGVLSPRKGIDELVDAVEILANRGRIVVLRILGEGPLADKLRARAANSTWLEMHAPVPHAQVAPFLQTCDVFAMPARNEPDHQEHDGHAVMEAMACGLPVITTRSGVMTDLVNSSNGILVREAHVPDLSSAICALQDNPQRAVALGQAGRRDSIEHFSIASVTQRRTQIYEEVSRA